jgi:hypothetical protein
MARENRDTIQDKLRPPEAQQPSPVTPIPPQQKLTLEEAVTMLANAQINANARHDAQMQTLADSLRAVTQSQTKYLVEEQADKDNMERIKNECQKTAQQRTQEAADRKWPTGQGRYHCALMVNKKVPDPRNPSRTVTMSVPDSFAFPEVQINAESREEAQARYQLICGIRSTDHTIAANLIGGPPPEAEPELKMAG